MGRKPNENETAGESQAKRRGHQIDPLTKDIICAMVANPHMYKGHSLDDELVIKTACRLRDKLVSEKLAEPAIHVSKS